LIGEDGLLSGIGRPGFGSLWSIAPALQTYVHSQTFVSSHPLAKAHRPSLESLVYAAFQYSRSDRSLSAGPLSPEQVPSAAAASGAQGGHD
jgi:hypothetical protein